MKLILFDGVCNLCNAAVNWVIDHDKKDLFKFASLQADFGKRKMKEIGLGNKYMDTIVFMDEEKFFTQSDAVLHILKYTGGIYSLAVVFFIVPKFIRDFVYKFIANHRYQWFGKREICRVPTPELKAKFLE